MSGSDRLSTVINGLFMRDAAAPLPSCLECHTTAEDSLAYVTSRLSGPDMSALGTPLPDSIASEAQEQ